MNVPSHDVRGCFVGAGNTITVEPQLSEPRLSRTLTVQIKTHVVSFGWLTVLLATTCSYVAPTRHLLL